MALEFLFGTPTKKKKKRVDPLASLRTQMGAEAKEYRANLPSLQEQRAGLLGGQAQEALNTGLETVREGYNKRGLLYSGLRQGAETGLRGQVSQQLRSSIAQSNKELEETALGKERTVAAIGLQHYGAQLEQQAARDQLNMQNELMRARAFSELGQAAGYAAGSYMGSQTKPTYASQNFQQPQIGSQYASPSYGLGGNYSFGQKTGLLR